MLGESVKSTQAETAAALYALDVLDLGTAALVSGITLDELEAIIETPAVETECLRLQADNRVTELRAAFGLDSVVERLVAGIAGMDSQAGLIRTGEFLHRVSGLQERRAAAVRAGNHVVPQFGINIVLTNDDGTKRILRIGGGDKHGV